MMKRQLFLPISVHQASVWPGEFVVLVEWVLPAAFSHCVAVAPSPPSLLETSATEPLVSCLFSSLPLHSSLFFFAFSLSVSVSFCVSFGSFFSPLNVSCICFSVLSCCLGLQPNGGCVFCLVVFDLKVSGFWAQSGGYGGGRSCSRKWGRRGREWVVWEWATTVTASVSIAE